jgi:hypothetical protein
MTPAFWIFALILAAARSAFSRLRGRLARWRVRISRTLHPRPRAKVVLVTDAYLHEYTGLTRADLERAFGDPARRRPRPVDRATGIAL